jgi:DNA-binding MarR family transcriptional regulator
MSPRMTKKEREVEAVMAASRALVAIVARSFAEADVAITLQQWRVLVIVSNFGPISPGELAKWLGVHPSSATRACDALVRARLLDRREDPHDRRRMVLTLTGEGEGLVDAMHGYRRQAIANILDELPSARRGQLAEAMQDFADTAGDNPEHFISGTAHAQ